jgi:hypothetical protein
MRKKMLKLFIVRAQVDNGMERFGWHGFVFEESMEKAVNRVKEKFHGDFVDILYAAEATPTAGMILHT